MICPKCKTNNAIEERYCINCGYPLSNENAADDEAAASMWFKPNSKKTALIGLALVAVIIILLVIFLVVQFSKSESEEIAELLAEGVGHKTSDLLKLEDVSLEEKSTYSGVTDYIKFSYLNESGDEIKVDGVKMPEWLVTVFEEEDVVTSVILYDFTVMENTYKGLKADGEIKLSSYSEGDSFSKVEKAIDLDPYTTEYNDDDVIIYTYKYYYIDSADNEQARTLVVQTKDGKYVSSTTTTVFPAGF
ncbi:MAG: hypothetical protein LUC25_00160 [Ruminococcus sp.]|nr:hypothetical protein [Ruminococcus sp.]